MVLPPHARSARTIDPGTSRSYDQTMRAVAYVVFAKVRSQAVATIVLSGVVAIVLAIVLALVLGAHRTETVPERLDASNGGGFDYVVTQQGGGRPLTSAIAALPGVEVADSFTFVFGGLARAGSPDALYGPLVFSGTERAFGARIVAGRAMDQGSHDEFVATRSFLAAAGATIGDRFDLYTVTQEQGAAGEFGRGANFTLTATLVGVIDGASMIEDPTPFVLFPPTLLARPEVGVALTLVSVQLADGTDEATLRNAVAALPAEAQLSVEPANAVSAYMQRAISAQARGTWLLALVAGVAAVVALSQLIIRQMRLSSVERDTMLALGFSRGQVFAETMARAAPPIVVGGVLAAVLSIPGTALFPTGTVRPFDPDQGVLVDWTTLLVAAVTLIAAMLLSTGCVLAFTRTSSGAVTPSPVVDAIAARSPVVPAAIGMRLGFTHARGERGSMRAALAGVVFTVSGLVAAVTFGASLDRLIEQPFRYGWNMDANLGDNGGEELNPDVAQALEADANVASLVYYAQSYARANGADVPLMGMDVVRGHATPLVLAGRLPVSEDEIAFGRVSARRAEISIGDTVMLTGEAGAHEYAVVGTVVLSGLGSNEGVGEGALTTIDGLHQIADDQITSASVDFGMNPEASVRAYAARFDPGFDGEQYVPSAIASLSRVRSIPYVLAGLLALLAVVTITHTLLTSLRARRHDLAIVRALGAAPAVVRRSVHWQATLVTLVPALIGAPLGFVVGRVVFTALADDIGALSTPAFPSSGLGGVLIGVVVLANLVALWPARLARRWSTAAALRSE